MRKQLLAAVASPEFAALKPKGPSPMPTDLTPEQDAAIHHKLLGDGQPGLTPLERELYEALREARKIIADIDDYMKRPERGDWGAECACCMGELLDDDRNAIARIDAMLTERNRTNG